MARFTNQAQLRYGNAVANSNIAVGEILEVLAVTKTAVRTTYGQNDRVTYVINIRNSGTTTLSGLTLSDDLGAYLLEEETRTPLTYVEQTTRYFVNGVLQPTLAVIEGPPLQISGISVPAGGNAAIVYETAVNTYAPLAQKTAIVNTVTVSGTGITPVQAQETIYADEEPLLTITKSLSPVPVTENGTLTYTFVIQNSGNTAADADSGVVVTDRFLPILKNITVSFDGKAWTEPDDYSYDETTGEFATKTGQITIPAATYTQDATGAWSVQPGVGTLVVTGTI